MTTPPVEPGPDVHTLTGAYAVDALTPDESAEFEAHLARCEDCREEVRGLRETVALLGVAASAVPPPRLKARVLAEVARTPQLPPVAPPVQRPPQDELSDRRRRRSFALRPLAVAASALLAVSLGLGTFGVLADRRADESADRLARIEALVSDPGAQTVRAEVTGGGTATLLVSGQEAVVLADGLAPLPDDRIYQVWVIGADERIRSAGLGPQAEAGASPWSRLVTGVDEGEQVALSVEPEGGSEQPTTVPIVALGA